MANEQMEEEQLIKLYFKHPELAFNNWYKKMVLNDLDTEAGELTVAIPSLEEIKNKFKLWYAKHIDLIKKCICEDFNYLGKEKIAKKAVDLALLMLPFLKREFACYCELAAIFILSGFEQACLEIQNESSNVALGQ
ncbi:MAG: hypothetical protein FWC60_01695 [Firmicutes bacterium]|nr:hypothetical protein [Bacillota bacterium]